MAATGQAEPVLVGRILGAWGLKGGVQVYAYTDPPEAIFDYQPWLIQGFSHSDSPFMHGQRVGRRLVAQLRGIDSAEQAAALADLDIHIPRHSLPPAAPGEYYWHDLIGLSVENAEGRVLGTVRGLLATGAHDVLQIEPAPTLTMHGSGAEILIPFVIGHHVKSVALDAGRIYVDWPLEWLESET